TVDDKISDMRGITLYLAVSFLVPISALKCWELSEAAHPQDGKQLERVHQKSCNENTYCVSAFKTTHLGNFNVLAMGCESETESTVGLPKCKTDGCFRTIYKKFDRLQPEDIELAVCCCNVDLCYRSPQSGISKQNNNLALPSSARAEYQRMSWFDKPTLARVARNTASGNNLDVEPFLFYKAQDDPVPETPSEASSSNPSPSVTGSSNTPQPSGSPSEASSSNPSPSVTGSSNTPLPSGLPPEASSSNPSPSVTDSPNTSQPSVLPSEGSSRNPSSSEAISTITSPPPSQPSGSSPGEVSPILSSPQSSSVGSLPHPEGSTSVPIIGTTSAGVSLVHGEVILYLVCFVLSLQFLS
uniref:MANSC domain-containing protein n=1 Tax=Parascaris univalens TaxID=6257 RepID=A0A915BKH2_PARUN